jgi:DNA-binding SARP family transcriptional activator
MTAILDARSSSLRFRVLGPFEFCNGRQWTVVGATKQRALLSLLLLNANRVTPSEQLIAEIWGELSPASARTLLAGYVWRLRRLLGDDDGELLVTRVPGYQLVLRPDALDVNSYERLSAEGRARLAADDLSGAVASFGAALALWRGSPFVDVPLMPSVMAETARLDETRLAVIEARIDAEIRLGRHEGLLPELKLIVAQNPLRERLHAHLMLVLYRCGQQAEALGAYRDLRRLLVDELGIEPSKPLRELQQRILREDPALLESRPAAVLESRPAAVLESRPAAGPAAPVATSGPAPGLPPPPRTFVGQEAALAVLAGRLRAGEPVCAIHGLAGAGKTALALRAARDVADHFPDGQIYLDLQAGASDQPPGSAEVVSRLLPKCGARDLDARADGGAAARWNEILASRRMLIVLDGVLDSGQLGPLLAIPGGSALIIVGFPAQPSVEGPNQIRLGPLGAAKATQLLSHYAGQERVRAEPTAAAAIVQLCEALPLALRIAAVRLTLRADWSLQGFADRLADPRRRLDLLACDGLSVRASLAKALLLAQHRCEPAGLPALGLLGALDLPVVSIAALSALLNLAAPEAERLAAPLVDAGLIEPLGVSGYRVPQLVRLFARETQPGGTSQAAAQDAVRRVTDHYIGIAGGQLALLADPSRTGEVLAWYRREYGTLSALTEHDRNGKLPHVLGELRRALPASRHSRQDRSLQR